jgi:hypothetical protein
MSEYPEKKSLGPLLYNEPKPLIKYLKEHFQEIDEDTKLKNYMKYKDLKNTEEKLTKYIQEIGKDSYTLPKLIEDQKERNIYNKILGKIQNKLYNFSSKKRSKSKKSKNAKRKKSKK